MTFLPIVERELRVAARRRGTYGMRVKVAGAATLAFAACFITSLVNAALPFEKTLFWGLSGLCMLYCLAAGRLMTADCLSSEKREGTLGLLFLTDLNGFDVVLGKLAATSLDGLYALLAVFPMLAIPLLAGGMTSGEFWRMVLVLLNTFLFSLTIGLCVSAMSCDERKVMGANFALLLWLAAMPPAIAGILKLCVPGFMVERQLFYPCPVFAFWQCADARYRISPKDFWWSIAIVFSMTLLLLLLACRVAPQSWQDKPASRSLLRRKGGQRRRWWREGSVNGAAAFRKRLLGLNAYFWLSARPYLKATYVWVAVGVIVCFWASANLSIRNIEEEANIVFALLLNVMLKLWITTEAGQQFAEDKKSGAFELLFSTPLTVGDVLCGQHLALRRQFFKPLVAAVIAGLLLVVFVRHNQDTAQNRCLWLAGTLMLVADAVALGWVGMSAGLTSKNHGRATIKTAACVLVLPWFLFAGVELAAHLFMFLFSRRNWDPDWKFDLACWFGAGIFTDLLFALKARRRLQTSLRKLAMEPYTPKRRLAWLSDWRTGTPERKAELRANLRRKTVAAAAVLMAVAGMVLYDIHATRADFPKTLDVLISQNNNPVRLVGEQEGFLLILPDSTLWSWGRQGIVAPPRRVGTNSNWVQVSVAFAHAVGLRSDGTVWTWAQDGDEPKQFGSDHDWAEVCAAKNVTIARKRDGTLWTWGSNQQNNLGVGPGPNRPDGVRVGTNCDWKAIGSSLVRDSVMALRADGSVWTWGPLEYFTNGVWGHTNYPVPVQFCKETNWVGFTGEHELGAQNQAGESWGFNPPASLAGAGIPVAAIGHLISSNAAVTASGPLFTTNWTLAEFEVRSNGTLWAVPWSSSWNGAPTGPALRVGQRSDWVSICHADETMLAATSDGTLWTWGSDYGQKSHWTQVFDERIRLAKIILGYVFGATPPSVPDYNISDQYPSQKEPRPLLRLVATNSVPSR